MIDGLESLLPAPPQGTDRLTVVSVGENASEMIEMASLLRTLGVEVGESIQYAVRSVAPATYLGSGKLEEIAQRIKTLGAHAVIIDYDVSPRQIQNIQKAVQVPTLDRAGVIIEIFSQHARTRESKTQVELARLKYFLPRLAHLWTHFERQRGGIGQKGMGEKQIEVDRRLIKRRIRTLESKLESIRGDRAIQRTGREGVLSVALVGYTNAGKSTLLNALTHSHVRAEDKLFATLDSSARALDPNSHPPVVAVDTVGFIRRIPADLIASFRSTLEEAAYADLLLHVVDGSSDDALEQIAVTEETLRGLSLESKPRITVINKSDLISDTGQSNRARLLVPGAMRVSAHKREDMDRLRDQILNYFRSQLELWEIVVPYSEPKTEAQVRAYGSVETERYLDKGTFLRVRIDGQWAKKLELERFR